MKKQEKTIEAPANAQPVAGEGEHEPRSYRQYWRRQKGGVYYHRAVIAGHKNVFVPEQYLDLMVNALKMAELKKDIKNLAYVIMPNHVLWMFKLNSKQDNPVDIIKDVKKDTALEIIKNLRLECENGEYHRAPALLKNKQVGRSPAGAILWTFKEIAKQEENKKYRIWQPKTGIRLIENSEDMKTVLTSITNAPLSDRWQMAKKSGEYPYLYVAEDFFDETEKLDRVRLENEAMEALEMSHQTAMAGA